MKKIYTIASIIILLAVVFIAGPKQARADVLPVTGWAWSSNIGWIQMNTNVSSPVTITTTAGSSIGTFNGYAWSSNIGWIIFAGDGTQQHPNPTVNLSTGAVSGWIRAVSAVGRNDGWDGWIELSGVNHTVTYNPANATINGYAWGSDVVGWIQFVNTTIQFQKPVVTITATPTTGTVNVVNPQITWSATNNPTSCTASDDWTGTPLVSGSNVGILTTVKTYKYTLTCTNSAGASDPKSATVVVSAVVVPTLTATLSATPSNGEIPLTSLLTATSTGTATGAIGYKFKCKNSDTLSSTQAGNTFLCNYAVVGQYTASVEVTRQGVTATAWILVEANPKPATLLPDLIAYPTTPTTATAGPYGSATTFTSYIENQGTAQTNVPFYVFFQTATSTTPTVAGVVDLTPFKIGQFNSGAGANATYSLEFPDDTPSTIYMRACADKSSSAGGGIITESNETNNCGLWTTVTITNPKSDLIASSPTENTATVGVDKTFTSIITNQGTHSTVVPFHNLFQVSPTPNPAPGQATDLVVPLTPALDYTYQNNTRTITSPLPFKFTNAGTYYVRACANKNNSATFGSVIESNYNNNCSPSWTAVTVTNPPAPIVDLDANPTSVVTGANTTLTWSSANATSCSASGSWSGSKATTTGTATVGPLSPAGTTKTFTLTCTGPGGTTVANATVNITAGPVPTVTLTASPTTGVVNVVSPTLTWISTNNPTSCTATGDWSGPKNESGTRIPLGVLNTVKTYKYEITCANTYGRSATSTATIVVTATLQPDLTATSPTLSTTTPTKNIPLTFSSYISNIGSASTNASFPNFFQVSSTADGSSGVNDLTHATTTAIASNNNRFITSPSYTFTGTGTYYVRACANKYNRNNFGPIVESNNANNCSPSWVSFTVVAGGTQQPPVGGGGTLGGSCVGMPGNGYAVWVASGSDINSNNVGLTYKWGSDATTTNSFKQINGVGTIPGPQVLVVASSDGRTGSFSCGAVVVGGGPVGTGKMWVNNNETKTATRIHVGNSAKVNWDVGGFISDGYTSCTEDPTNILTGWYDTDSHINGSPKLISNFPPTVPAIYNLSIKCTNPANGTFKTTNSVEITVTDSTIQEI